MIGQDVFELDMDRNVVVPPVTPNLKQSACTPLWYVVYSHRPTAKAVIHTHSIHAQMATLLDPSETSETLCITHLEMLKGVGHHSYDDVLEIPIIDNRPSEDLLAHQLESVIQKYPKCNAVLVRRHGLYVWGDSWEQAKTQCESFDYLFESAIAMRQMGIDFSAKPLHGTYRVNEDDGQQEPAKKRAKSDEGFRGMGNAENEADLRSNVIPLLPRDCKVLLLDIEGCTTSISFVKEILFPYVSTHLQEYLEQISDEDVSQLAMALEEDVKKHGISDEHPKGSTVQEMVALLVQRLMDSDVKATGLKSLQGKMWKAGYDKGELKGHVYDDFVPLLQWCQSHDISVNIYSSGSVQAQKLLFGHSSEGDLTKYLDQYFDTKVGSKKEAASYQKIGKSLGASPSAICFVSDAEGELVAAKEAGIGNVVMSIRPGNVPLTNVGKSFPAVYSLLQLCGT
jgi:methylthioribulose 1-phosphate dehydratase/enolase-phosphatase E1